MGRARQQRKQRFYILPLLLISGISLLVLYLSAGGISGQLARAPLLSPPSQIVLSMKGSLDTYWIDFTNKLGTRYSFSYVTSANVYKYGDTSHDFVFIEASSPSTPNIGLGDFFVLSNQRAPLDTLAVTHIIQYTQFDASQYTISFFEQGSGQKTFVYQCNNPAPPPIHPCIAPGYPATASLIFSGNIYRAFIDAQGNLAIDMNADSALRGTKINLVASESDGNGGFTPVVIDLGDTSYSGNGKTISAGASLPLTFYQGDPLRQQIIAHGLQIKPSPPVLYNNALSVLLQVEKSTTPY